MSDQKFAAATWRLTAWYLAILMCISIGFSAVIYQTSSREMAENAKRQAGRIRELPFNVYGVKTFAYLNEELEQSRAHLRASLVVYNLIILATGGAASFWFARRTLRPIEAALEAQGRFTADASHELRTPLTAMRSEIEVALRDKGMSPDEARELLRSNLEEIEKLESLSTSLLQLAHYEEGSAAVVFTRFNLATEVEKSIETFKKIADPRGITIAATLKPVKLHADAAGIRELLQILLDNAIKYSPDNSKITVTVTQQGHSAVLAVQDEGLGIKAIELPHLFDRFYRADTSRSKARIDGYGLGLSIAKSIATSHRGSIDVQSTPGKGSVFTVKLPLSQKNNTNLPV